MSEITLYHNPGCSKSRETLALLQEQGIEPTVVEYLKDVPDAKKMNTSNRTWPTAASVPNS
jgi:arsenate reductase (glutaredoxin)